MPLYEYECPDCGQRFDRLQGIAASSDPPCPSCGGRESRRLISIVAGLGSRAKASFGRAGSTGGCGCGGACACGS